MTKVETRVEHAVVGDLLVEFEYSNYQNMNGVQVPTRIVQRQAGMQTFDATHHVGDAESAEPHGTADATAAAGRAGGAGRRRARQAPPVLAAAAAGGAASSGRTAPVERIGEGVFKIGGNYTSLAIDMGDHILVVESGQNDARGMAVMAAAKQAIPNKPIRFVVNSQSHFDHAGGLAAAVAEGATILTHRNNEPVLERLLAGPRTLTGRQPLEGVESAHERRRRRVGDRDVRKGTNGKVVELHAHSERAQRRDVCGLPAGRKGRVDRGYHGVESDPGSARVSKSRGRRPDQLKLDYNDVDSGAPAESGSSADEGGCHAAASKGGSDH